MNKIINRGLEDSFLSRLLGGVVPVLGILMNLTLNTVCHVHNIDCVMNNTAQKHQWETTLVIKRVNQTHVLK